MRKIHLSRDHEYFDRLPPPIDIRRSDNSNELFYFGGGGEEVRVVLGSYFLFGFIMRLLALAAQFKAS